jgi:hypothetical protein
MDMHDDFDSLLRNAAEMQNDTALSGQRVSDMIDERLIASKNSLRASFKKEILMIAVTLIFILYRLGRTFTYPQHISHTPLLIAIRVTFTAVILFFSGSIILFFRLLRIARSPKDTGIREYIQGICTKTENAALTYLWVSTIISTGSIGLVYVGFPQLGWFWIIPAGIGLYYLNKWYINKRFGKQLREMKALLEEFK